MNRMEWNGPGIGICAIWQVGENWWEFSAPGLSGTADCWEEAQEQIEAYIAEKQVEKGGR